MNAAVRTECHLDVVANPADWRSTLATLPAPHVLQSWEWGECKAQAAWSAHRYAVRNGARELSGAFQLLLRRGPGGLPFTIGYIPKGPVIDWCSPEKVEITLSLIARLARRKRALFVKIDPDVREDRPEGARLIDALRTRGWRYSADQIQFKNTAFTPLEPHHHDPEGQLLAQMKSKCRYNIRLARRRGVHVRPGTESELETFYKLYLATAKRDGFAIRPYAYYALIWQRYLKAQKERDNPAGGALFLATHEEEAEPLAGLFLLRYADRTWYFYGASSNVRRRDMPNYLLQWEALRWTLNEGSRVYDWWGAPTDPNDPGDSMAGVWHFKQGFGAQLQHHVGAWDLPTSAPLYHLYHRLMPLFASWF